MTMTSDPFSPSPRVEVITSVQRRRRWTTAEKVRLVEEAMQPGMSVSYVARRAGIAPSQLFAWKRRMLEGGATAVQADDDVVGAGRVRELEKRVRDLERMLGKKTMEVEILKEALDLVAPKKPPPLRPCDIALFFKIFDFVVEGGHAPIIELKYLRTGALDQAMIVAS